MVIPSTPGAPPLAFTRCHARSRFSRERICSNRSSEAVPCFPSAIPESAGPVGFNAGFSADGVEPLLTSSGLRSEGFGTTMPSADFCAHTTDLSIRRARRCRRARSTDLPE